MKKKIFSITPNPALDLGGFVEKIVPNEKSYVENETRFPGGNAINAARILSRLNIPVTLSGFLGGSTGEEIRSLLEVENLETKFIKIKASSRINITVSNRSSRHQTRLSFPGPNILVEEKKKLFKLFEQQSQTSLLLLGGSLPKGFTPKDLERFIFLARRKNIVSFVDCPGDILAQIVEAKPFFMKPNLEEFQELTRSRVKTIGAVIEKAKRILDKVPYICVSSVEGGALLISRTQICFGRTPNVHIQSTVGAGDSMVGGMISQFYKNEISIDEVLKWGLAASAATLSESGTKLGSARKINQLYLKTKVTNIKNF